MVGRVEATSIAPVDRTAVWSWLRVRLVGAVLSVVMLGYAAIAITLGQWAHVALTLVTVVFMFVPNTLERLVRLQIPGWTHGVYASYLFAGPFLGSVLGFYGHSWRTDHWDSGVHLASGSVVSMGVVIALSVLEVRHRLRLPLWAELAAILATGGFAAGVWEVCEFTSDHVFGTHAQNGSLVDTMGDIIFGLTGTVLAAGAFWAHRRWRQSRPIDRLLRCARP